MYNKEKIERMFLNSCGYFGINFAEISKIEKHPEFEYSLFVFFKGCKAPCLRIKHKNSRIMNLAYKNIMFIKNGSENKVVDFLKFKKGV